MNNNNFEEGSSRQFNEHPMENPRNAGRSSDNSERSSYRPREDRPRYNSYGSQNGGGRSRSFAPRSYDRASPSANKPKISDQIKVYLQQFKKQLLNDLKDLLATK